MRELVGKQKSNNNVLSDGSENVQCTQWTTSLDFQWKQIPKSKSNPKPKNVMSMNNTSRYRNSPSCILFC